MNAIMKQESIPCMVQGTLVPGTWYQVWYHTAQSPLGMVPSVSASSTLALACATTTTATTSALKI